MPASLRVYEFSVELDSHLCAQVQGVWMDAFYGDSWITAEAVRRHLDAGKSVCLVSPELHGRDHHAWWERLFADSLIDHPKLMICSDITEQSQEFFAHG